MPAHLYATPLMALLCAALLPVTRNTPKLHRVSYMQGASQRQHRNARAWECVCNDANTDTADTGQTETVQGACSSKHANVLSRGQDGGMGRRSV